MTAEQATDDIIIIIIIIIMRMPFSCCVTKATDTHSEYVILLALHSNNSYANAPEISRPYIYIYIYIY